MGRTCIGYNKCPECSTLHPYEELQIKRFNEIMKDSGEIMSEYSE